ncbi:MAG: alkaline phosphatase family protein, partial [Myxococcota bacterium]|nr:alkaline phosphatase family protein [Myxococcota bacterium]
MHRTFATLLTLGACTAAPSQPSATVSVASPGAGPSPRLVVLVVIDQLGTFHLDRSRDHLRGGFARMLGPDAWHGVGMHPHAKTETCPGHVTLATGAAPAVHGIPGNRFLVDGEKTYCADLALMRVESIGDVFSEAGGSVVALSLKDRAALFLAGSTPTLAAWTDKHGVLVHRPVSSGEPVAVAPPLVGAAETRAWLAEPWAALDPGAFGTLPAESPYENDHGLGLGFPKRPA